MIKTCCNGRLLLNIEAIYHFLSNLHLAYINLSRSIVTYTSRIYWKIIIISIYHYHYCYLPCPSRELHPVNDNYVPGRLCPILILINSSHIMSCICVMHPMSRVVRIIMQNSCWLGTQPMVDGVTLKHQLSLAGRIHRMIPGYERVSSRWPDNYNIGCALC